MAVQQFISLKQASVQLNIPFSHIKIVKLLYPEGFTDNGNVKAELVRKYYEANKAYVIEQETQSLDTLKKEKLRNDIILQKLEIAEQKHKVIELKELELFLRMLGLALGSLLKSKLVNELPQRIDRVDPAKREDLCKEIYNEIAVRLQEDVDSWLEENINTHILDGETNPE